MTKKLIIAILALCTILTTSQAVLAKEKITNCYHKKQLFGLY